MPTETNSYAAVVAKPGKVQFQVDPRYIKRIGDPFDEDKYKYELTLPIDVVAQVPFGNINPRSPIHPGGLTPVMRAIKNSILEAGTDFHARCRGIWMAAHKAEYDNKSNLLTLYYPTADGFDFDFGEDDSSRGGILDGGHVWETIRTVLDQFSEEIEVMPWVDVRIRVGYKDDITEISAGLNTSQQLRPVSLLGHRGELKELKDMARERLGDALFEEIAWTENDVKGDLTPRLYTAEELIRRLVVFNVDLYPNTEADDQPMFAYSSRARLLNTYVNNKESFEKMALIAKECFQFYDIIEANLAQFHKKNGTFGNLNYVEVLDEPTRAPSLRGVRHPAAIDAQYSISTAVILPIMSALRNLVSIKNGKSMKWKIDDPFQFFLDYGNSFYKIVERYYAESKFNPNALGKNKEFWMALHTKVRNLYYQELD